MFSKYLKTLSILKKFLFINLIIFTIIGLFTFTYLNNIEPSLLKKKPLEICAILWKTFYEKDIAASTTATGRKLLLYGKKVIEDVYGDTICETKGISIFEIAKPDQQLFLGIKSINAFIADGVAGAPHGIPRQI